MSARKVIFAVALTVTISILLGCSGLFLVVGRLNAATRRVRSDLSSVSAAKSIEINLLVHHRQTLWEEETGDLSRQEAIRDAETVLRTLLEQAKKNVSSAPEGFALDRSEAAIDDYLKKAHSIVGRHLGGIEADKVLSPALAFARMSVDRLVAITTGFADAAEEDAAAWQRVAEVTGAALGGLGLLVLLAVLLLLQAALYKPVLSLRRTMERYAGGETEVRAALAGPTEVRDIEEVFNDMANRLGRQRENQLGFISSIAHDVRSPLTALLTTVSSLKPGIDDERLERRVALIRRQVFYIDRLLTDLLDVSRIEAGKLALHAQPHDLRTLLADTVDLFSSLSARHRLQLSTPDAPVIIHCDPERLSQVFNNLVSNAIKYSPDGGAVTVSLRHENGRATVEVRDEGVGIPADEQRHLFEPFRRLGAHKEQIPGIGLGLSIARRIVQAHVGEIRVRSQPGQGTAFFIDLPVQAAVVESPASVQ